MSKLNLLIAWPYLTRQAIDGLKEHDPHDTRFLLDSGAFSAWKNGSTLKLQDYLRFIDGLPIRPWRYFMLDVIGDPAATRKSYEESLKLGYQPIPIFTRGSDVGLLGFYYATSDLVAIGGLVGTRHNKGFVNGIMRHVGQRKVHWLGFLQKEFLAHYKPYSADSSSVTRGMRFGEVDLYTGNGRWLRAHRTHFQGRPRPAVLAAIASYHISASRLADRKEWINSSTGLSAAEQVMFRSWAYYQHDIEERLGVKLFIAGAGVADVQRTLAARSFWQQQGLIPKPSTKAAAA